MLECDIGKEGVWEEGVCMCVEPGLPSSTESVGPSKF